MIDSTHEDPGPVFYVPDLIYTGGRFESGRGLLCDSSGRIVDVESAALNRGKVVRLKGRAMLPGLVNAHSHAFQRVLRGRTEHRTTNHDSFWTWREMMYSAATRLTPEDIKDVSRMAFLEMAESGITAVGEFHYIHHDADGRPYDDANLVAKIVIEAALEVGLRIALLRVAYVRSGHRTEPNPQQFRFIETDPETYLRNTEALRSDVRRSHSGNAWVGVAPHSVRAVPLAYLRTVAGYAKNNGPIPFHMHVAEQPAEVEACVEEYGRSPIELLHAEGLLEHNFTGVHAIHITAAEARHLADAGATVCACPTTERNLGDGIVPAKLLCDEGVSVALGTDSQVQIDLFEDARELEYHLRLQNLERAVLAANADEDQNTLASRLFDCTTINGARSIGARNGKLEPGFPSDFFTVDLEDPSIAGAAPSDLISSIVFGVARTAVRDVYVGGKQIVTDGRHHAQSEVIERFAALQRRLWR